MKKTTLFARLLACMLAVVFCAWGGVTSCADGSDTSVPVQGNGDVPGDSSGNGGTPSGNGDNKIPGADTSTSGGVVSKPIEIQASGSLNAKGGGWLESAWIEWFPVSANVSDTYNVYVRKAGGDWAKIDKELIRGYGDTAGSTTVTKFRADALGLAAGSYDMKVELASDPAQSAELSGVTVLAHDRSGFAFKGGYLPGAYKADGTLKDGALVVYVDNNNFNSVKVTTKDFKGKDVEFIGVQALVDTSGWWKSSSAPLCIRIIGKIDTTGFSSGSWGSSKEGLQVKCSKENQDMNVTIEGVGEDATLHGFGILCRTTKGVEIRNLGVMVFADDGISLDTGNLNTWVHNLDIFYGGTGSDSDQAKGDGSLDVKGDSKNQTYSYIHFWDSGKMSLCGMKDETGPNYITYHHNWFDHSDSRHPRVRTMTVHVYNNYYDGNAKYGAGATTDSDVFVENNYFRNCKFPMLTAGQGNDVYAGTKDYKPNDYGTFSDETGGAIKSWNNKIVDTINITSYWPYGATEMLTKGKNVTSSSLGIDTTKHFDAWEAKSREEKVPSTVVAFAGGAGYSNFDTDSSIMYTYRVDTPDDAKTNVENFAGRMRKGAIDTADFYFNLNNYTPTIDNKHNAKNPDEDYNIIKTLKEDLIAYKSKLVSTNVTANSTSGSGTTGGGSETGGDTPSVPTESVALNKTAITLKAGASETLVATLTPSNATDTITWSSSNTSVAVVSNGKVTALVAGTATITASAGDVSAQCSVTVEATFVEVGSYGFATGTTGFNHDKIFGNKGTGALEVMSAFGFTKTCKVDSAGLNLKTPASTNGMLVFALNKTLKLTFTDSKSNGVIISTDDGYVGSEGIKKSTSLTTADKLELGPGTYTVVGATGSSAQIKTFTFEE